MLSQSYACTHGKRYGRRCGKTVCRLGVFRRLYKAGIASIFGGDVEIADGAEVDWVKDAWSLQIWIDIESIEHTFGR